MPSNEYDPAQREKQRRRDFKKSVDKMLRHSDFSTPEKREYNRSHKNKLP